MSQVAQQGINPTVIDPDNVPEVFVNGPLNINVLGQQATITFTNVRPDVVQAFSGKPVTDHFAVVRLRVTIPLDGLVGLKGLLNQMVPEQPMAAGSPTKQ